MDSQTLATREKSPKWLSARYELVFLMTLARLVPVSANLVADDWSLDIDANWILVCNNRYIGSGMHVAPDALIDDGLMDILLIPKKSKLEFIYHLPKIFQGRQLEVKGVQIRKAKSLTLKCRPEQRVACDGDLTFPSPAKISIRKNALALRTSWINGRMVQ
jgi:diacylglycerol kinase (ATP)